MVLANSRSQAVQALEKVTTVLGSDGLVIEEAEHPIHGALYVVHCGVKQRALI